MKLLSQRDPRWANVKLGKSSLLMGRYGCTTTAISMLSDYFGSFFDPTVLGTVTLKYTPDGLLLWPSVDNITNMRFEKRLYGRHDSEILKSLKDPDKACILEVEGRHWVTAMKKTLFGNSYIVADPWLGDKCDVLKRYKTITGSAHFLRK